MSAHSPESRNAAFLALGDSYTIGEGVAENERWPMQLAARLRAQGVAIEQAQIIARTGWTTDELSAAMDEANLHPPYALVTLLIGVNNQYRGRPPDEYRVQFGALLARAIALAGDEARRVVVVSIPDWGVTPFARSEGRDARQIATQIDAFNVIAHGEADAQRARFVDITGFSRAADLRGLLTADGLHPSGAQYARWVEAIAPAAREALTCEPLAGQDPPYLTP
ncbi:MAG TPA: SGNH/GDSL hydrolase family protein [Rhodanobacteraceae bacterium]|nr:SGNH/GDSL hydrolase family protein [Rhodanobacteraceae bacterium]